MINACVSLSYRFIAWGSNGILRGMLELLQTISSFQGVNRQESVQIIAYRKAEIHENLIICFFYTQLNEKSKKIQPLRWSWQE